MRFIAFLILIQSTVTADFVEYEFSGTVKALDYYTGEGLIPVEVGDPVSGQFVMDLGIEPDLSVHDQARFKKSVFNATFDVGGIEFTSQIGDRGFAVLRDNFFSDPDLDIFDSFSIYSPPLEGSGLSIYRFALGARDETAVIFDDLSISNFLNLPKEIPGDGSIGGQISLRSGWPAPYINIDLESLEVIPRTPGDANGDGSIDSADLNALALNWQQEGRWGQGDFNYDDIVNATDLNELATNWNQPQITLVPEPALSLSWLLILTLLIRRNLL